MLVEGAEMPGSAALPAGLAGLARRNAQELSDGRWRYDTDRLIAAIERNAVATTPVPVPVPVPAPPPEPAPRAPIPSRRRRGLGAAIAGAAVLVVAVVIGVVLLGGGGGGAETDESSALVVAPGAIKFQPQTAGTPSDEVSVVVRNTGTEPFSLRTIKVLPEGSPFKLNDKDCIRKPLGPEIPSCRLGIEYVPADTGGDEATLFVLQEVTRATRKVELAGTGVEPSGGPGPTTTTSTPGTTTQAVPAETTGTAPVVPPEALPEGLDASPAEEPPAGTP